MDSLWQEHNYSTLKLIWKQKLWSDWLEKGNYHFIRKCNFLIIKTCFNSFYIYNILTHLTQLNAWRWWRKRLFPLETRLVEKYFRKTQREFRRLPIKTWVVKQLWLKCHWFCYQGYLRVWHLLWKRMRLETLRNLTTTKHYLESIFGFRLKSDKTCRRKRLNEFASNLRQKWFSSNSDLHVCNRQFLAT